MKKAFIYCRVSTEEQAKEGYSLDAQEKFCSAFARNNGYKIIKTYRDEGKSATNLNRPALQDLLAECQKNKSIEAVFVQETDRLARNTKDHLTIKALLQKADVKLISVAQPMLDDSPEGNMIDTILASVNQFQSDINSRKTRKGLQERFDSGWWPGWSPLGYMSKTINNRKVVVPDPEKWHLIRKGLRMYLTSTYSVMEVIDYLHKKGLRSKNDKMVPHSIMVNTLKNPFYAGIMKWNKQEKAGKHKPMISIEEYNQIQTIMASHNQHACRRRKFNFLLRGFVFCDICGQRYTAEKHREDKTLDYYHCSARTKQHSNKGQNVDVINLEKQVENEFKKIQFSKGFIELTISKVKKFYEEKKIDDEKQKRILLNKKMKIEKDRDIAEKKLISGVLSDDDFIRIRDKVKNEMMNIQDEIEKLDSKHDCDIDTIREALNLTRNIHRAYKKASDEVKRLYLGFFWEGFFARDKRVIRAKPTQLLNALIEDKQVIISSNWLCG